MDNQEIIKTHHLTKLYNNGEEIRALDGVDISIEKGEIVAIMGPSGSGKSTLLHMIGALDRPTSGQVFVAGQDLAQVKRLDRFRNRTVGFVFQLHNLIPTLTALENVEVPLHEQQIAAKQRRKRAAELLDMVGLGNRQRHMPSQLSGGQRQRVAIARALINNPALILADEPTGELDSERAAEIMEIIHRLNRELGTSIIIVTHDPAVARRTERIVELDSGRVLRQHRVGNVYEEDWKNLRASNLGQALMNNTLPDLIVDGISLSKEGKLTDAGLFLKEMLVNID